MSKSEVGLMVFSTLLMIAITISYFVKPKLQDSWAKNSASRTSTRQFRQVVDIQNDAYESWSEPDLPSELVNADQKDLELIEHIREHWILPPSVSGRRLNHPEKYDHSVYGQSFVVDKLLKGKEDGFYVETWAGDGETNSNSLFMEKDRLWDGILIEPNPADFAKLVGKRRRAYLLNACVSPSTTPSILNLTFFTESTQRIAIVQCFPLFSVLAALDITTVDYLSVKAQGMEVDILGALPLDEVDVNIVDVQTLFGRDRLTSIENAATVKSLLTAHDFEWVDAGDRINRYDVIMIDRSFNE